MTLKDFLEFKDDEDVDSQEYGQAWTEKDQRQIDEESKRRDRNYERGAGCSSHTSAKTFVCLDCKMAAEAFATTKLSIEA